MTKGVIIIHGLTGTPVTMAPLTTALAVGGFIVNTPLLPGHGTSVESLSGTKWREWVSCAADAYDQLAQSTDEIYSVGLSLGSLLAINLALDKTRPLKKIACLGTPLKLSPMLENFLLPLSHIPPVRQLIRYSKKDWAESVGDKDGLELYKQGSYHKIPVSSVWQLQGLQRALLPRLKEINLPMLIIHSRRDTVAPPINVKILTNAAKEGLTKVVWLLHSRHVITLDSERDIVSQQVVQFFS
jgi:carboxylesterase